MKSIIVISQRDNVATTLDALEVGEHATAGAISLVVRDTIPSGHKVALAHIARGSSVVKYGSAIGVATADIEPGAHVHTHNVASTRGRGDLHAASRVEEPVEGRLAEPSDAVSEGVR